MEEVKQRKAAKEFAVYWKNKGYEKGESQKFWISLLHDVFDVEHPEKYITFEDKVFLGHTSFIDAYIEKTKVLIEQKAIGKDLTKPIKQSDGSLLTPFQQAKRYITELPVSKHPRWVITCNFEKFLIYDMEKPAGKPEEILLKNLEKEYYRLEFLIDSYNDNLKREMDVSIEAGKIVGLLYDAFLKQYKNPESTESLHSLNVLCVRLVFCLYAEDAEVFGRRGMFHDYLERFDIRDSRRALIDLFEVLDTQVENRDPYLDIDLAAFPYVNGGLFTDRHIEIPFFTEEIRDLILNKASRDFDWSEISPTIFGAVFESTLNPAVRRSGGMHYTSIENIHKVIDPLFLDELKNEYEEIREIKAIKTQRDKLEKFQQKLASLKWLDPACGSGNFLTETFISIRKLENKVISALIELEKGKTKGQIILGAVINPIKVSIEQFYGIEINDFAVTVAKTALWIAESQMMKQTEDIIHMSLKFLPLKTYANIIEANALRIDWESVVPKNQLNYIMGNPPFVGYHLRNHEQQDDMALVFGKGFKKYGVLDYVAAWYKKASDYMVNTKVESAFVSTNSISQGQQPAVLWEPLMKENKTIINFAHRTFKWGNDGKGNQAAVHCVIIGFSDYKNGKEKKIFDLGKIKKVEHINTYLVDEQEVIILSRKHPICNVLKMNKGCQATDGGFLLLNEAEKEEMIAIEPESKKWIRKYSMGVEFINNIPRYCLWLVDISPSELRKLPKIKERIANCQKWRSEATKTGDAYKLRDTPHLFRPCKQFRNEPYIAIPKVSSSNRRYIPMGFIDNGMIPGCNLFSVFGAKLYHFGVLTSNVHMAWMRTVAGRLKSDYSYSNTIVYNNFPWPTPTEAQKAKIEKTAQAILDARDLYPESSLADLYDPLTMPKELLRAHQANDKAVMSAYGWKPSDKAYQSESECVAELMKMYQKLTEK